MRNGASCRKSYYTIMAWPLSTLSALLACAPCMRHLAKITPRSISSQIQFDIFPLLLVSLNNGTFEKNFLQIFVATTVREVGRIMILLQRRGLQGSSCNYLFSGRILALTHSLSIYSDPQSRMGCQEIDNKKTDERIT